MSAVMFTLAFLAVCLVQLSQAKHITVAGVNLQSRASAGFLQAANPKMLRDELHQALFEVLGLDHGRNLGRFYAIRKELVPTWRSLAKNKYGGVDRRSLRYIIDRYLKKAHSISIVGLEPLQHQGKTNDDATLVMDLAPKYVKQVLLDERQQGYTISDAVAMIAILRELVVHDSVARLERLYHDRHWDLASTLNRTFTGKVVEDYLIRWLVGADGEVFELLDGNQSTIEEHIENYGELVQYTRGVVQSFQHERWRHPRGVVYNAESWRQLGGRFSFQDVQHIVGGMTLSFGKFWHSECLKIKGSLRRLDHDSTGRIKLSDFHGAALQGEWRFTESKDYLAEIGVLDTTSIVHGPQVILANYLQGASNCVASDDHYRICCPSDCEEHMSEIEAAVKGPYASPEQLLEIVGIMTVNLDDAAPRLTSMLQAQLKDIAATHQGVPIHGRLFAQWLHYVFPQDCPFPHKVGAVRSVAAHEYGNRSAASISEIKASARASIAPNMSMESGQADWLSQWSEDEELLSEHIHLQAPWQQRQKLPSATVGFSTIASAICLISLGAHRIRGDKKGCYIDDPMKAYYV